MKTRPVSLRLNVVRTDNFDRHRRGRIVLRDGAGAACAYGGKQLGQHWIRVPRLGTFELSPDFADVHAYVSPSASQALVLDGYYGTALPLFTQATLGYEVLHASAVLVNGGAVAFCGFTGVGKSTIASALSARGFELWADDAIALASVAPESPASVFLPFMLNERSVSVAEGRDQVPLLAVCVLERVASTSGLTAGVISRPSPSVASAMLLEHAYRFSPQALDRRRKMVQAYINVTAEIPVLLVRFVPSPLGLPELLGRIESTVARLTSEPRV
ncbi:MAG: hypothetical protein H0W90_09740 [Actinobacteria bacterium]|nr:hypothetical protein [Actinomycetota bacterium]